MHLSGVFAGWQVPEWPDELGGAGRYGPDLETARDIIRRRFARGAGDRRQVEIAVSGWLYRLVRGNVRRGHAFELAEVLSGGRADCLGYARLFSLLGPVFGVTLGVVEVLIDNAGRYVPHHANLLNLADGTHRLIDAWYGSVDIKHRRLGALVRGQPRDINRDELVARHDITGLPAACVEAIALYIKGNRYLERGELDRAINYYTAAVALYPHNSRAYYNRAVAQERKGAMAKAQADYARALQDESGLIRILATTGELEELIKLDEKGVGEREQGMYLWYKGYKTGAPVGYAEIGRIVGVSPEEARKIIDGVARLCTG